MSVHARVLVKLALCSFYSALDRVASSAYASVLVKSFPSACSCDSVLDRVDWSVHASVHVNCLLQRVLFAVSLSE